ncbi:MAG: hypothetical protein NVS2B12_04700 [Ktedonobacteraceae bacterium]
MHDPTKLPMPARPIFLTHMGVFFRPLIPDSQSSVKVYQMWRWRAYNKVKTKEARLSYYNQGV